MNVDNYTQCRPIKQLGIKNGLRTSQYIPSIRLYVLHILHNYITRQNQEFLTKVLAQTHTIEWTQPGLIKLIFLLRPMMKMFYKPFSLY